MMNANIKIDEVETIQHNIGAKNPLSLKMGAGTYLIADGIYTGGFFRYQ